MIAIKVTSRHRKGWKSASDIFQRSTDRRVVRDHSIPIAVVSSGCREGIVPALELQGLEIRNIVANGFDIGEDGLTTGFNFHIAENKADLLLELLETNGVDPAEVMYIGDSLADAGCFQVVGYPVVSFFADHDRRERFVRRFGSFVRVTTPGLHFKLPFKIEKVNKVPIEKIDKEEFGFQTAQAGVRSTYSRQSFDDESLMLTGDLNILDVEWIVQFKREDPVKYLVNVRDQKKTLRDISEAGPCRLSG